MTQVRTVVITGAGRGLGFASAIRLHRAGWHVVAAMRSPQRGLAQLADALHLGVDDPRLTGVTLDLCDGESIISAAKEILDRVGAPDAVVHNAGLAAAGCVEDAPDRLWEDVFATNLHGPVRLTNALLPALRAAGRGRIVYVASAAGLHGMPTAGVYGASKAAAERWAESLSHEVSPFGLGVSVLVAGTFKTDILSQTEFTQQPGSAYDAFRDAALPLETVVQKMALPPERFARALEEALGDTAPYARHFVGRDVRGLAIMQRALPNVVLHRIGRAAMRVPKPGSLR